MELFQELEVKTAQLDQALKTYRHNGVAKAEAEYNYQIAKSQKELKLMEEGMTSTMIKEIIRGVPEIAKLRLERDIAQVVYDANAEAINVKKIEVRIIENQLNREWSNTNG